MDQVNHCSSIHRQNRKKKRANKISQLFDSPPPNPFVTVVENKPANVGNINYMGVPIGQAMEK
jgi:hypothetical protein